MPYCILVDQMSIRPVVKRTNDVKTERPIRITVRTQTAIMQILCSMIAANVSKSTENQHRVMKIPVGIYPGIDHGMNINGETAGNGIVQ